MDTIYTERAEVHNCYRSTADIWWPTASFLTCRTQDTTCTVIINFTYLPAMCRPLSVCLWTFRVAKSLSLEQKNTTSKNQSFVQGCTKNEWGLPAPLPQNLNLKKHRFFFRHNATKRLTWFALCWILPLKSADHQYTEILKNKIKNFSCLRWN